MPSTAPLATTGIIQCGQTVVHEEGVRALWKGLTPFATHLTLKYALRMGSNSVYQVGACLGSCPQQGQLTGAVAAAVGSQG
jgi:solute carrier family 25 citrate transporter 1